MKNKAETRKVVTANVYSHVNLVGTSKDNQMAPQTSKQQQKPKNWDSMMSSFVIQRNTNLSKYHSENGQVGNQTRKIQK